MRGKFSGSLGLVAVVMLLSANVAAADVTLGTTVVPTGAGGSACPANTVIGQATSDSAIPYAAPVAGVITAWQVNPIGSSFGDPVTLVVLRPAGGGAFSVVGADAETIPASGEALFTTSIPVHPGDTLGLYTNTTEPPFCFWNGGSTPTTHTLMGLGAPVAPSAGQTLTPIGPNSPGGYLLNVAATLETGADPVPPPLPAPVLAAPVAPKCTVLRLTATPLAVAKNVLSALGCKAGKAKRAPSRKVPRGTVIKTTPKVGAYPAGKVVHLVVSSGPKKSKNGQKQKTQAQKP